MANTIFKIQTIGETVFNFLEDEDLLNCRLTCKMWKLVLDSPIFWLEKLKSLKYTQKAHEQWLDLIQKSIQVGKPKENLSLSIMLIYFTIPIDQSFRNVWLNLPPIHTASIYGQLEVVKLIHQFDKDCNRPISYEPHCDSHHTPLSLAIKHHQTEVVKYLVENIENAAESPFGSSNSSPLQSAIMKFDLVKILAPRTQNLNHQNISGTAAIHMAIKDLTTFKYLMSFRDRIDVNLTTRHHLLPLHFACKYDGQLSLENRIEIVKTLIPLTHDTDKKDRFGKSPLDYAKENGHTEIVKMLSEKSIDNFLNKVCNHPNDADLNGRLPLHEVCMKNSLKFELDTYGRLELVKTLMILTSDINYQDKFGSTALHHAAENGFHEIVKLLLEKCDANIGNENGYLPIDLAIFNNDVQMVKILVASNTSPEVSTILQRQDVQEYSWKCFDFLNQMTRKRSHDTYSSMKPAKRTRYY